MMNRFLLLTCLLVLWSASALLVIYNKHESRSLFRQIQNQEKILNDYQMKWAHFKLEIAMLQSEDKVEYIATNHLNLKTPTRKQIIYIRP